MKDLVSQIPLSKFAGVKMPILSECIVSIDDGLAVAHHYGWDSSDSDDVQKGLGLGSKGSLHRAVQRIRAVML